MPQPIHLYLAKLVLGGAKIKADFFPIGYEAFLVYCLRLGGITGIIIGQGLLYVTVVCIAYELLRLQEVNVGLASAAAFVAGLHPSLLFGIRKVTDSNLSAPAFLILVLCLALIKRKGPGSGLAFFTGSAFGVMVMVRPNFITLLPLVALVWIANQSPRNAGRWLALLFGIAGFFTAVIPLSLSVTNKPVAFPSAVYGSYNLLAGANPHSAAELWKGGNAEPSLLNDAYHPSKAIRAVTFSSYRNRPVDPRLNKIMLKQALEYIIHHPVNYLYLALLKLWALLRPDYRLANKSVVLHSHVAFIAIQTILALLIPMWVFIRILCRIRGIQAKFSLAVPIAVLYVLPFLLTNADPRHRYPLDLFLLLDTAFCWSMVQKQAEPKP